ncbi:MAG TPA: hypothetical protein V6D47_00965 [Oscillatoriaceae cyanobacterium]
MRLEDRRGGLVLPHLEPEIGRHVVRAVKMVALAGPGLTPAARHLMAAGQRHVLGTAFELDALAPITPEELASAGIPEDVRPIALLPMLAVSLADGTPQPAQMALVESFAAALGIESTALRELHRLAERQLLLFRLDFIRHGHIGDAVRERVLHGGVLELAKNLLGQAGLVADPALAARYHALAELPKNTLGYALWHHFTEHGFAFPGEKHGFPEAGIYHDVTHVLSGYPPTPEGELQVAAFTAGFKRHNPHYVLLFVLLTFSAGYNVTPAPQPDTAGIFAQEGLAEAFFTALERGGRVNMDLTEGWNFWEHADVPVDELRARLGVTPLSA